MVLADTSVWIDHFRKADPTLVELLLDGAILVHPFVLGEIACGNLRNRRVILENLATIARPGIASHEEVLRLIEEKKLGGQGIGWIDAHLLASALLSGCGLWTKDERLNRAAGLAGVKRASL